MCFMLSNSVPEKTVFPGFDKDRIDPPHPVEWFAYFTRAHAESICDWLSLSYADFISLLEKNILNDSGLRHKVLWLLIYQVLFMQSL